MASLEECKNFVRPPGEEEEDVAVSDPRWGPLDDEDMGHLIRRIDFQKIIDFHTKDLMHKLVKSESITKKLKDTVTGLQGELKVKDQKIADLERRVATSIDHTEERLEMIETKQALIIQQFETKLQTIENRVGDDGDDGDDGEKLQTIPFSMAQYRPEREKRPPCPVPAILPVFPYPGANLPSRRVYQSP